MDDVFTDFELIFISSLCARILHHRGGVGKRTRSSWSTERSAVCLGSGEQREEAARPGGRGAEQATPGEEQAGRLGKGEKGYNRISFAGGEIGGIFWQPSESPGWLIEGEETGGWRFFRGGKDLASSETGEEARRAR